MTLDKRSSLMAVTDKRPKYCDVPLNLTARQALKEYLGTAPRNESPPFPTEMTGGALTERAIGYIVRRYAALARVSDLSSHNLRHCFGYRMAESVQTHLATQALKPFDQRHGVRHSLDRALSLLLTNLAAVDQVLMMARKALLDEKEEPCNRDAGRRICRYGKAHQCP